MPFLTVKKRRYSPEKIRSPGKLRFWYGRGHEIWKKKEAEGVTAVVLEEAPREKSILFHIFESGFARYKIEKPWSYLIVMFDGIFLEKALIFFSRDRLKSDLDESILLAPLPNMSYYGYPGGPGVGICLDEFKYQAGSTLIQKARRFENYFWESTFNEQLDPEGFPRIERSSMPEFLSYWEERGLPRLPKAKRFGSIRGAVLRMLKSMNLED